MTQEEHRQRHVELHKYLDELVADRIGAAKYPDNWLPSRNTVMELMQWSHEQTITPHE